MAQVRSKVLVTFILSALIAGASAWMVMGSQGVYCDRLPSLTVCATLAAFAIAMCFRQLSNAKEAMQRWVLAGAILIAAITIFADAHFVLKYRGICAQMQEQIRQMHTP
jgi:uncharacterized BrkB/YihY/UPF0761 family membrane protein